MSLNPSKKRRAAIQVQFTWLFALLAGAVIFLFFVMFIRNLGKSSEQTFCADVREHLTTVFASAQTSLGTMNNISIPKLDIQFDCTGYNLPCRESFGNNIIFSPQSITGHALITYARGWDMPYRSSNMLYLTQPEVRYIFFEDIFDDMGDILPDAVNKDVVSLTEAASLKNENSPTVRVVVKQGNWNPDNLDLGALKSLDSDVLSVVEVKKLSAASETAEVTYFEKTGDKTYKPIEPAFTVIGEEALLGAVFSGSSELFGCTLNRALKRYMYVTEIYYLRAEELKSASMPTICKEKYEQARTKLLALSGEYGEIAHYMQSGSPGSITTYIGEIAALNNQLKLFSCPTLY